MNDSMVCVTFIFEYAIERLSIISHVLDDIQSTIQAAEDTTDTLNNVLESVSSLNQVINNILLMFRQYSRTMDEQTQGVILSQRNTLLPGRPSFNIEKEQLEYLRSLSFTWVSISKMLLVSRMTIYRHRLHYGLIEDHGTQQSAFRISSTYNY